MTHLFEMRSVLCVLLLLGASLSLGSGQPINLTITVFISGITNETSPQQNQQEVVFVSDLDGRQFQAAVDLAVEAVNNRSDILNGYNLQVQYVDSQCSAGPSVQGFIEQIFDNTSQRVLIIGSDCSTATEPVAELAPFWGLVQISPLSSGPDLTSFSTFLRLVPSDNTAAMGVISLMEQFGWTRLGLITQQEELFTSTADHLMDLIEMNNFTTFTYNFNTGDMADDIINNLLNSPARISFLNVYPSYAIEILCRAQRLSRTFSQGYLWLLYSWYPQEWWRTQRLFATPECTSANVAEALNRAIIIDYLPLSQEGRDKMTPVGLTRAEYEAELMSRLGMADSSLFSQTHLYFDAVLMGALALNTTSERLDISSFNYDTADLVSGNITEEIMRAAMNRAFRGVSGLIDLKGERQPAPVIQYRQYILTENDNLDVVLIENIRNTGEIFPSPPGTPVDEQTVFISNALFIVYTILSCLGIVFAILVALFLLVFRHRMVIKWSSPLLNMLIILGAAIFYVDVILFGVDIGTPASESTVNVLCMLRMWLATLAFTLLFGPIFLKTWRVHYAFLHSNRNKKRETKIVPDWVLFVTMGVLLAIDVVFMIIVTAIPETRLQLDSRILDVPASSPDLPRFVSVCFAPRGDIWVIILFVYKGLPLLVGMFLAFETRKVKIRQLNDSKVIGMSVYIIAILSLASAIIGFLLSNNPDVFYGVVGILIILCNTSVLCLLLIPKFYKLWKDPEGLRVLSSPEPQHSSVAFDTVAGLNDEVDRLKEELRRLNHPSLDGNHLEVRAMESPSRC